ncbi:MAG TPA: lipopolysaccharide biosynthesis protein [Roseiarcus sp.]|nr:lipopolysaccharide biosynthesis protein [Roseiarcus sp.]
MKLVARLARFALMQRAMVGATLTLGIKASGALLMIAVFTLAARSMSTARFGEIAMWFNALSCLAVASVFGQDTLIVRSWGEYGEQGRPDLMVGAYRFGWATVAICAGLACAALLVADRLISAPLSGFALAAACAFLAAQIFQHYSSHSSRTIRGYVVSEPHRELTWRLILLAVVALHLKGALTIETFFFAAAAGMALSTAIQTFAVLRRFPVQQRPAYLTREWLGRASGMCLSASVEALSQYAEVIILGLLATPSAAAGYFIAMRIANIFPMMSTGLNTYTVTKASSLHFGGQTARLQGVMRSVMTVAALIATPTFIALALVAEPILSIFGPSYVADYPALIILASASFIVMLCGPSPGLLLITGDEKLWSRIAALSLVLRIALMSRLAPEYGAVGAAMSWAIVNIPVAISASLICRRRCGVDPSVASLLSYRRQWRALRASEASTRQGA